MKSIDAMLSTVEWTATDAKDVGNGLPFATHEGVLNLFGHTLRCYILNDGRAIFHADDCLWFFGMDAESMQDGGAT